ncbi:MAG TPA: PKD domain-containing protein, partial [Puia sp.]|nr:PKD domain-containing protein [Puia sp.]
MNRNLFIAFGCLFLLNMGKLDAQAPGTDFSANPTSGCGPLAVRFTDLSTNRPLFWSWDFGNGQTSTQQNPLVTYNNAGTYTVILVARNKDGANVMQKTNYITVFPFPHAFYTNSLATACVGANVQFTDASTPTGAITSWNWVFGDGSTSNLQNPAHTYNQIGYFNVSLTVSNGGCSNTINGSHTVRIVDGVKPNFTFEQTSASCLAPYSVNFLNQTAGPGTLTYNWTLGTGAIPANSAALNPSNVIYPSTIDYTVSLQVQSSLGCSGTIQKTLPFGSFQAKITGPDTTCINTPVTFSNASTPTPTGMTWKFGDGTGANNNPTTKTYKTLGTFPLTLVNKYTGCLDSTINNILVAAAPVPDFKADTTKACKPSFTVNFTDQSTGFPVQWLWNFGDGATSTQKDPQHSYTQPGNFDVTLTVTGSGGCSVTTKKTGFITIQAPTVTINNANNLGACVSGGPGNITSISPSATINSVDNPAGYTYLWSAPGSNEGSSTSATPTFTYNSQNTYTLTVTITSPTGCQTTSPSAMVLIGNPTTPASADFTMNPPTPPGVCGRDSVAFAAVGSPADHWEWIFGDNTSTLPLTTPTIKHSYRQPGTYDVYLSLINHGCPLKVLHQVTVNPPIANFGYKVLCNVNSTFVHFIDSSFRNPDPSTISYVWSFGDGTNETVTAAPWLPADHQYAPGHWSVTLTINDGSPCTGRSYTKTILVGQIAVAVNPVTLMACKNKDFQISSTSNVNPSDAGPDFISSYTWIFSPGATIVQTNPVLTTHLSANGVYNLSLQVTDTNGCTYPAAPATAAVITITSPTAHFTAPAAACKNSAVPYTDNSTPDPNSGSPITAQVWEFDTSTLIRHVGSLTHAYPDTGYYRISMTISDAMGCFDTYTQPDSIHITSPYAAFSGPDSFYCPGIPLQFIDSSFGYGITETWDFGDGSPAGPGFPPTHTYANPGQTYPVKLTVTDQNHCTSTYSKSVDIEKPVAAFDIADTTSICTPLQTLFTAHTQFIDSLYWNFGDGTTSTLPITSHFYNTYGNFTATLYARGPGGCFDSASRRVQVIDPVASTSMTYSPTKACDSVPAQFNISIPPYVRLFTIFGDDVIDSSQNLTPFHMYRNPNTYNPRVGLEDSTGCIVNVSGKSGPVTVLGAAPFFSIDKHKFCDSSLVTFLDYTFSNNGIASETYVFGDGSPSQTQSPGTGAFNVQNFFTKVGTWPVTLNVVTDSGCRSAYSDTVVVYQTPHPVITVTSPPCAGLVQFQGSLTTPQIDTITWAWNFGNGQTSANQNPSVKMAAGNYSVTLIASVSLGCRDTANDNLTIHVLPLISGPKQIMTPLSIPVTIPFSYSSGVTTYEWSPPTNLDCPT